MKNNNNFYKELLKNINIFAFIMIIAVLVCVGILAVGFFDNFMNPLIDFTNNYKF